MAAVAVPQIEGSERWSSTPMRFPSAGVPHRRPGSYIRFRTGKTSPSMRRCGYIVTSRPGVALPPAVLTCPEQGYKRRARYYNPQITRPSRPFLVPPIFTCSPSASSLSPGCNASVSVQDRGGLRARPRKLVPGVLSRRVPLLARNTWHFRHILGKDVLTVINEESS